MILMRVDYPGHDATGPVRSLRAIMDALGDDFELSVIAFDRKFGEPQPREPFTGWTAIPGGRRLRLRADVSWLMALREALSKEHYDVLWLNSVFDPILTLPALVLRRFGLIPHKPTILAPHGEFSTGALSFHRRRKKIYMSVLRTSGLLANVSFQATGPAEAIDIARFGFADRTLLARNIPAYFDAPTSKHSTASPLKVVFLSRLTPMKNLQFALAVLSRVSCQVEFNVYGPAVDTDHVDACRAQAQQMPANIKVRFMGECPHRDVPSTLSEHDLFFLPTRGENFGYAIYEALMSGVPVLISDRTPWRGLQNANAGWELPLEDPEAFVQTIEAYATSSVNVRSTYRTGARAYAEQWFRESGAVTETKQMLQSAIKADVNA